MGPRFPTRPALVVCAAAALVSCGRTEAPPTIAAPDAAFVAATNTAVGLMGRYDFDAAVEAFRALAERYPSSAEAHVNLAVALINRQQPDDAADAERRLRNVPATAPVARRASYLLGLLLLYQGRDGDAAPLLEQVAAAEPADPYPAYFAGQARLATAPADALRWFDMALARDPLLRSASYGAFQALQRLGRGDEAAARLETFQSLERDPRARMAEFKYTRMGPLAEAQVVDVPGTADTTLPAGGRFLPPSVLAPAASAPGRAITVADIDGDGAMDLFVAGAGTPTAPNLVLLRRGTAWQAEAAHPLARVPDVRTAAWGDLDNDGLTDVALVRGAGRTALWRQQPAREWRDVTTASRAATPSVDAVDAALFDADHDGDLDLLLLNGRGANAFLNNDGNGRFRDIGRETGLAGDTRPSLGLAIADLDADRDHDLVILKASPPHVVLLNDRVWRYRPATGVEAFAAAPASAVLAADLDANGRPELYTTGPDGLRRWAADDQGTYRVTIVDAGPSGDAPALAIADTNGDGALEIVRSSEHGWAVVDTGAAQPSRAAESDRATPSWTVATLGDDRGPSIVGLTTDGVAEWAPGPGRGAYATFVMTGTPVSSDQRRSNASGVGTRAAVRTGSRWTAFDTARASSTRGHSLQPFAVGLGRAPRADLVTVTWSDGIMQSEIGLEAGRRHVVAETQRQLSSCPVLFAFDGTTTRFVSDILGVGGIGFFEQPGVYSTPYPQESFLLPDGAIAPADGRYRLVIGEPMEEITYLDQVELDVYDLPPGWQLALDERKAIASAPPTGAPLYFRDERLPARATTAAGDDVTALVTAADLRAAPIGAVDPRFIGRTSRHVVEMTFERLLDHGPGRPVLLIDGWVEYPYAQTVFAAWQAGVTYDAPTLEARDARGRWHAVAPSFGYPAGMPRRMALPLPRLPEGTTGLRLSTTQEVYWDRIAVVYDEPRPDVRVRTMPLVSATLAASGFATRTTGPQRTPSYDYDRRVPLWDTRHPRGWYTRFGDVMPLVATHDDATVVLGPGEDVTLEFAAPAEAPPPGWTRRVVVRSRGWCKDMDLYTADGETVAPMPGTDSPARTRLHAAFNTRYEGGQ